MTKPPGWSEARLDEVAEVRLGRQRSPDKAHGDNLVPYLRAANVRWAGIDLTDVKSMQFSPEEVETFRLRRDDILVVEASGSRDEVGKSALWREELPLVCLQNTLIRVRPRGVNPEFLRWHLHLDASTGDLGGASKGIGIHHIGAARLASWLVRVPPLNEQRRIVAKLDAIFEQTRATRARLERLPAQLDKLKHSVLAAAFRGDLTADWRSDHPDVEPATVLLAGIRGQRRDQRKDDRLPNDVAGMFAIPPTWEWRRFDQFATDLRGGTSTRAENATTPWPILRSSAVRQGDVDFSDVRYLASSNGEAEADLVREGDLLFTRLSGTLEYVGNCAIVRRPPARATYYPDRIFRAQLDSGMCAEFVELAFSVQSLRGPLETAAKSTAGHQRISLSDLREFVLPVPPLAEQKEIVRLTKGQLEAIGRTRTRLERACEQLAGCEQAALARAFRGELVAGDSSDEPALMLLERLRAAARVTAAPIRRPNVPKTTRRTRAPQARSPRRARRAANSTVRPARRE